MSHEQGLLLLAVLAALAALLVGAVSMRAALRWFDRFRRRARARQGLRGESRAERLLERAGFTVLDRQVRHEYRYRCDDRPRRAGLRADFLARRSSKHYVVEVKTGELVTRLEHAATRRQLLEYQHAFETDGVVLVNAETGELSLIEF